MNIELTTLIKPHDICNLGRLPIPSSSDNPLRKTVKQILKDKNIKFQNTAIYHHYTKEIFNPETLADFYKLESPQLANYKSSSIFLPWIHTYPVEKFVNSDFYGTRDNQKIIEVVSKLKKITSSIQETGYNPEKFTDRKEGFMTGYWLLGEGIRKFYIISGNHRSAVLGAIDPDKDILVRYEKCGYCKKRDIENNYVFNKNCLKFFMKQKNKIFINIINKSNVDQWPSVKNRFLNKEIAIEIFNRYTGEK
jgi:hypothetical protein